MPKIRPFEWLPVGGSATPTGWRSIVASDGAGIIELANMLKAQAGRDMYVILAAHGESSCTPEAMNPANPGSQGLATARVPGVSPRWPRLQQFFIETSN